MCGNRFEAQKVSTKYCSHSCNSKHYKLKLKIDYIEKSDAQTIKSDLFRPKVNALDIEMIKRKEFLTVSELSVLFNCSRPTVYNMIKTGKIIGINIGIKKTIIKRSEINKLFETPTKQKSENLFIDNCYTMDEIKEKYGVSRNTIYNYVGKHGIERIKENGNTLYSRVDIDNLFNE
jgi:excisionase family DNA binding protein